MSTPILPKTPRRPVKIGSLVELIPGSLDYKEHWYGTVKGISEDIDINYSDYGYIVTVLNLVTWSSCNRAGEISRFYHKSLKNITPEQLLI